MSIHYWKGFQVYSLKMSNQSQYIAEKKKQEEERQDITCSTASFHSFLTASVNNSSWALYFKKDMGWLKVIRGLENMIERRLKEVSQLREEVSEVSL